MKVLQAWVEAQFPKIKEDLFHFLRFKTISADPASRPEQERCAAWLENILKSLQCKTEIIPTPGFPLVYAEDLSAGPNAPTLMIYGHYDVQPVDPLDLWHSDPFVPTEKDGNVYARGAVDDKGQIFFAITALRALRETKRKLPVNLKFCIEGEEEFGSKGFLKVLPSLKNKLRADYLMVVDFDIVDAQTPSINLGARGIITLEATLRGSASDLHSGAYGGIAYNPNRALAELLTKCWDENGVVQIPHFYDDVAEMSMPEKKIYSALDGERIAKEASIQAFGNEKGKTLQEANWFRPTLEINGMAGGYAGPGFKTVIPAEARAKISCRLVPNQNPEKIGRLVADFLRKNVKKGIEIKIDVHHGGDPYRGPVDSKLGRALSKAYEEIFNKPCLKTLAGGSIPVVASLVKATGGAEVYGMGYCLSTDLIHAPNEHFGLDRFKKGVVTVARAIEHLAGA